MKVTRDPITLQPMVQIANKNIVLQKDATLKDIKQKPAKEITECAL